MTENQKRMAELLAKKKAAQQGGGAGNPSVPDKGGKPQAAKSGKSFTRRKV